MQRHGCGMAGIPKGKERFAFWDTFDVSPVGGTAAAYDCRTARRGRLAGDPSLPGQHGALVVNCLWFLPLGFPRGEAVATKQRHFGTDVFVVTDEGRRTVGQEMQLDERRMFQIVPFNREIQNF